MKTIYIATSNPGKLRDFAGAAARFGVEPLAINVAPLPGFSELPPVFEDGETFAANARKKAEFYSRHAAGALVLADDSGLEVFALNGAPGVRSARYAADGPAALNSASELSQNNPDAANNARLLCELESVPDGKRHARFVCALAAARDGRVLKVFEAEVRGEILRTPRGQNGFGYDPLFFVPELGKTTAELTTQEKAAISHRGRAFKKFLEWYRREET